MKTKNMSLITVQKGKDGEPNKERKCFYFDNDTEKPILAAGVLFVKEEKGKKYVLMQKKKEKEKQDEYSDFGGKIDLKDQTAVETIARELGEELNYGIYDSKKQEKIYLDNIKDLKNLIQENIIKTIYQERAKYFVIIARLPENISLDFVKIGDSEKLDKINRTVEWITYEDFMKLYNGSRKTPNQIHPRLWGRQILGFFSPKKFGFSKSS
jgi:8-oxo-dGTP pyrophosphatase MutT (NUDIX family)